MTADLSVVIASVNGFPYLGRSLAALTEFAPDVEVIVADCTGAETRRQVAQGWPAVRLLSFDEPHTVPQLRAAGIFGSEAPYVAVIEDHCHVTPGWAASAVAAHRSGHHVVGGPVRNTATGRIRDWAAFFCEYSAYMEPLPRGSAPGLTGMNVSYDRAAIATIEDLLREGRWESWLHPRLQERGFELYCEPRMLIEHDKDFGIEEFTSQRWHYSRAYAGMRNSVLGRARALYFLGTPLLPPLLYWRMAKNVLQRGGLLREFALATPLALAYTVVWAAGEAAGYALGGGDSLLKVR